MERDKEMLNWMKVTFGRHLCGIERDDSELPSICPGCERETDTIANRRRNSSYPEDESNWIISCQECFDEDTHNLTEMWSDYWSSVL